MAKEFYARFPPETEALILEQGDRDGVAYAEVIRRLVARGIEGEKRDAALRKRVAQIMGKRP